jgi:ADP-ribosylglycohydrolase
MDTTKILDRIKGMIFGAMYGDALGAPHEFRKDITYFFLCFIIN